MDKILKNIQTFEQHSSGLNISDVSDSFIKENKTQLEADVELKLIKFFEGFSGKFDIDRQWIVDRFNEKETENFINYMCNVLNKT